LNNLEPLQAKPMLAISRTVEATSACSRFQSDNTLQDPTQPRTRQPQQHPHRQLPHILELHCQPECVDGLTASIKSYNHLTPAE